MSGDYQLIGIARSIIEQFLREWQNEPYRWPKELNVQAELTSRLQTVFTLIGKGTLRGYYQWVVEGFEKRQVWSRVDAEHTIHSKSSDGSEYTCRPDIIIWDDIDDPDNPPDAGGGQWPLLFACEIKYRYGDPLSRI